MARPALDPQLLLRIGRMAVYRSMWAILREFYQPTIPSLTSEAKPDPGDISKGLDRVADKEIKDTLRKTLGRALDRGYYIVTEEAGPNWETRPGGLEEHEDRQLIVFIDPVDFTAAAARGLDGSILVSFYHRKHGMLAAVVGDIFRRRIYCASRRRTERGPVAEFAYYQEVIFDEDPRVPFAARTIQSDEVHLASEVIPLQTSQKQELEEIAANVFLSKSARLLDTVDLGRPLWEKKFTKKHKDGTETQEYVVSEIYSVGGSLGPIRVADATWDVSIEFVKGFRLWDFSPGAFIAQCAGATVINLDTGNEFSFTFDELKEESLRAQGIPLETRLGEKKRLDEDRRKFVVGATKSLAEQIRDVLRAHESLA